MESLPTRLNSVKRRIIEENVCLICTRFLELVMHALWDCDATQDVWARNLAKQQKSSHRQSDIIQLVEYLLDRLLVEDMELFFVQSWLIWNQ